MRASMLLASCVCLLLGAAEATAGPREDLVVAPAWLAQHLGDPDLVILHVGDRPGYEAAHIPGAHYVALSDLSVSDRANGGLTLEMLPAEALRRGLEALGISDASRIVVYYGKDWVSPSTRVVFTLDYAGLGDRTSLLDGGMDAWTRAGHQVTGTVPPPARGSLSPRTVRPLVVDAAYVLGHLGAPGVAVVDARNAPLYEGVQTGGSREQPHRTGHIAGARSVPFTSITSDDLMVRPAGELEAVFAKAGIKPGDTVIAYCHIGQQATAVLFAARTLGHKVLLYDGSFEDWSRHAGYPVDNPAGKNQP